MDQGGTGQTIQGRLSIKTRLTCVSICDIVTMWHPNPWGVHTNYERSNMNIMTKNGPRDFPGVTPYQLPAELLRQRADALESINQSTAEYNRTVETAHAQGRVIGWFPPLVNRITGERFDWGPKPAKIPLAPMLTSLPVTTYHVPNNLPFAWATRS